jgi:hypothetical protein
MGSEGHRASFPLFVGAPVGVGRAHFLFEQAADELGNRSVFVGGFAAGPMGDFGVEGDGDVLEHGISVTRVKWCRFHLITASTLGMLGPIAPSVQMNKTVYLPDDEAETWEKARRLANDRLSPVILKSLKEYIMTKEAEASEAAGFERIELEFEDSDDNNLPKRKAFRGKWILSPEKPLRLSGDGSSFRAYAVAITAKTQVVVYWWSELKDETGRSSFDYRFQVFSTFEQAAFDNEVNDAIREAVRKRGVPVEELDI